MPTTRDTLEQFRAKISDPPPRPRVFDCGCAGRAHPVCDPTFKRLTTERPVTRVRPMTLKRALAEGMTLRPHTTHLYRVYDDGRNMVTRACDCGEREVA